MFEEKDEKILGYKKKYKILQEKVSFVHNYQKNKKFNKKVAKKYGYDVQKEITNEEKDNVVNQIKKDIDYDNLIHKQNISFRDYCRLNKYIDGLDDKSYIWSNKTLKFDERNLSVGSKLYFESAGIKKQIIPHQKKEEKSERKTINFELWQDIESTLNYLKTNTSEEATYKEEEFFTG